MFQITDSQGRPLQDVSCTIISFTPDFVSFLEKNLSIQIAACRDIGMTMLFEYLSVLKDELQDYQNHPEKCTVTRLAHIHNSLQQKAQSCDILGLCSLANVMKEISVFLEKSTIPSVIAK